MAAETTWELRYWGTPPPKRDIKRNRQPAAGWIPLMRITPATQFSAVMRAIHALPGDHGNLRIFEINGERSSHAYQSMHVYIADSKTAQIAEKADEEDRG